MHKEWHMDFSWMDPAAATSLCLSKQPAVSLARCQALSSVPHTYRNPSPTRPYTANLVQRLKEVRVSMLQACAYYVEANQKDSPTPLHRLKTPPVSGHSFASKHSTAVVIWMWGPPWGKKEGHLAHALESGSKKKCVKLLLSIKIYRIKPLQTTFDDILNVSPEETWKIWLCHL